MSKTLPDREIWRVEVTVDWITATSAPAATAADSSHEALAGVADTAIEAPDDLTRATPALTFSRSNGRRYSSGRSVMASSGLAAATRSYTCDGSAYLPW